MCIEIGHDQGGDLMVECLEMVGMQKERLLQYLGGDKGRSCIGGYRPENIKISKKEAKVVKFENPY
ncbi:MAG: hypothetical protein WCW62_14200 [Bacteroidales bacterium]|jgi:hypothetical protein